MTDPFRATKLDSTRVIIVAIGVDETPDAGICRFVAELSRAALPASSTHAIAADVCECAVGSIVAGGRVEGRRARPCRASIIGARVVVAAILVNVALDRREARSSDALFAPVCCTRRGAVAAVLDRVEGLFTAVPDQSVAVAQSGIAREDVTLAADAIFRRFIADDAAPAAVCRRVEWSLAPGGGIIITIAEPLVAGEAAHSAFTDRCRVRAVLAHLFALAAV